MCITCLKLCDRTRARSPNEFRRISKRWIGRRPKLLMPFWGHKCVSVDGLSAQTVTQTVEELQIDPKITENGQVETEIRPQTRAPLNLKHFGGWARRARFGGRAKRDDRDEFWKNWKWTHAWRHEHISQESTQTHKSKNWMNGGPYGLAAS